MPYRDVNHSEHAALVALLQEWDDAEPRQRYRAWASIAATVMRCGSARDVWDQRHPPALDDAGDVELRCASAALTRWRTAGFEMMSVLDRRYPLALKRTEQISPLLFTKGELRADEIGVAVVGSRAASVRGQHFAAAVARGLVQRGISVVSGLARGVDNVAHRATLAAKGRTIGVLGTGVARVYPASNYAVHSQVADAGVLVSPFWPDCLPDRHTLVLRNATMAGLSQASIVVEAAERSGSRVHARYAQTFARPLILTEEVVAATRWGRQYSRRTGVYVADSVAAALAVIDQVVSGVDAGA